MYRTLHKYVLYLPWALEGLYKAKRDGTFKAIKKVKLKVNGRNSIPWPADMLWYSVVGIPVGNRILCFIPDNTISLSQEDHVNDQNFNLLQGFPLSEGQADTFFNFLTITNIYMSNGSFPAGNTGSFLARRFRVNEDVREFQMDSKIGAKHIYLEYISSGQKASCATVINHHVALQLKAYIHYREARFKLGAAAAETRASEQEYITELEESLAAQSDLTANGIMSALSQGMQYTIGQ